VSGIKRTFEDDLCSSADSVDFEWRRAAALMPPPPLHSAAAASKASATANPRQGRQPRGAAVASTKSGEYYQGQRRRRKDRQHRQKMLTEVITTTPMDNGKTPPSHPLALSPMTNMSPMPPSCQPITQAPLSSLSALETEIMAATSARLPLPLLSWPDLQLRFLTPVDVPQLKKLCKEWFPIDYPDAWYEDITSNPKVGI